MQEMLFKWKIPTLDAEGQTKMAKLVCVMYSVEKGGNVI